MVVYFLLLQEETDQKLTKLAKSVIIIFALKHELAKMTFKGRCCGGRNSAPVCRNGPYEIRKSSTLLSRASDAGAATRAGGRDTRIHQFGLI